MQVTVRGYKVGSYARQRAQVVDAVLKGIGMEAYVGFRHGVVLVSTDVPSKLVAKILLSRYEVR